MTYMYDPQLDHFELYHAAQESEAKISILGGPALPALGHAVSGATGAAISNVITYPLALAITRLQVQKQIRAKRDSGTREDDNADYKSVGDAIQRIYAEEGGLAAFYAGCAQDTLKTMADSFLFFLAYNFLRGSRQKARQGAKKLPVHEELGVGMLAGAFSKLFTTPVQQIVTRKQTASLVAKRNPGDPVGRNLSTREIFRQIREQKGLAGFWAGYSATLVLTVNPALTFLFHETLLRFLVKREERAKPGARLTFLIAALSKAMASTITYPFSLAKSRAQISSKAPLPDTEKITDKASMGDAEKAVSQKVRKNTIFATVAQIAREEGLVGLYQGIEGEVLKGFFSHGLTMLLKERIHRLVIRAYYLVLRLLQQYPSPEELAQLAREKATDAGEKVAEAARGAVEGGESVLDQTLEKMGTLYRTGKEAGMDILDDYVNPDDDDDEGNGWGW